MDHPFARPSRQADDIFVTGEQIRSLARRRGFESVATWAAECMGLSAHDTASYEAGVLAALVETSADARLLCRIQTDLERAGKPALSTYAGTIFANAVADALADLQAPAAGPVAGPRPFPSRRTTPSDQRVYRG